MKVVLAEKPSVARDIAKFLKAHRKCDGYLEGNGYFVTWALGHLVTLKKPDEYDPALKRWRLENLPFIPKDFQLGVIDNKGSKKQYKIVEKLFKAADEIICATDAGREGELIFRYILKMTGCEGKPFSRLWLSSMTEEAISEAFSNLKKGCEYDNLYEAARCRSEADWIVGLNATRNFTVRHGKGKILWSVGRVQTPVLAMLGRRNDEISCFRAADFWEIMTKYRDVAFKMKCKRFDKKDVAEDSLSKINGYDFIVDAISSKKENVLPPMLYDLTSLQRDMNKRYSFSAADTLKYAQQLYEGKLLTYPRTDSQYLSSDMKSKIPTIFKNLSKFKEAIADLNLDELPFTKRIVDDKKINDHHAIIPTGKNPVGLSDALFKVYDAVLTQTVAAFYPKCIKDITTVSGLVNESNFEAKGVVIIDQGWTKLFMKGESKEEDAQELPQFKEGERGEHFPYLKEGKTQTPKNYTENTLLGAMETAGKQVEDEEMREAMKNSGLGTPATRASIIETLIQRDYIERDKKRLVITDKGRYLIGLIDDDNLKSAELTGEWESKLRKVEQGDFSSGDFMSEITIFTRNLVKNSNYRHVDDSKIGDCPQCGKLIIEGKRGYGCSGWKDGCDYVIWKDYKGYYLRLAQVRELLQYKILLQPVAIEGVGNKILCLTDNGSIIELAIPKPVNEYPLEKAGTIKNFRKNYSKKVT